MKNSTLTIKLGALALLPLLFTPAWANSQPKGWKLVWSDEFNTEGHPDRSKWIYEHGYCRNHEAQYYTKERLKNTRCEGGKLILEAHREQIQNEFYKTGSSDWTSKNTLTEYTSGAIKTRGKYSVKYGRIEISAKLPLGRGVWPAFWMMGDQGGWPKCGEIDVMEYVGFQPDVVHANVHWFDYKKNKHTSNGSTLKGQSPGDGFHVYAVEWDKDQMKFYYDDQVYHTWKLSQADSEKGNPFHQPHYLLLNFAVGGEWGGQKGIDESIFPQKYEIDYVRVYQKSDE